jgi:hypothetical protein
MSRTRGPISCGPPGHVNCETCRPKVSRFDALTPRDGGSARPGARRVSDVPTSIGTASGVTSCTAANASARTAAATSAAPLSCARSTGSGTRLARDLFHRRTSDGGVARITATHATP